MTAVATPDSSDSGRVPRFAIAMPAYNAASSIGETVASVLAQTFQDWELAIVDDGSRDDTAAVALDAAGGDPRIRVHRQANMGCGPARGVAVGLTTGTYVCRLDADDLYLPDYLESMSRFIDEQPGFDIYSCNGERFYPDGHRELARPAAEGADGPRSWTLEDMLRDNMIFSMAIFTRDIFDRIGGFRLGVDVEDLDFWLRAMLAGANHIYDPAVLGLYRVGPQQMTASTVSLMLHQVTALREVADSPALTPEQRAIALGTIRRLEGDVGCRRRSALEERLAAGDTAHARADYLAARRGYSSMLKYVAAGALLMASPSLYAGAFVRSARGGAR